MGFSPREVDEMSVWEFVACKDGYMRAHGVKKRRPQGEIPDDRLREMGIVGF